MASESVTPRFRVFCSEALKRMSQLLVEGQASDLLCEQSETARVGSVSWRPKNEERRRAHGLSVLSGKLCNRGLSSLPPSLSFRTPLHSIVDRPAASKCTPLTRCPRW